MSEKKIQIGGQAVIEGVMMRGPDQIATAIRRRDGSVDLQKRAFVSRTQTHPVWKLPIIRGFVSLIEMLIIGIQTLNYSAERYEFDDVAEEAAGSNGVPAVEEEMGSNGVPTVEQTAPPASSSRVGQTEGEKKPSKFQEGLTIIIAFLLAFVLFGYVPYFLSGLLKLSESDVFFNLFAGLIRIVFFVLYVYLVSLMKEIQRVFEYHGAEHKAVFTHEQRQDLNIENVQKFSTIHPRCGTSFMFLVLLIAILVFSIIDTIIAYHWGRFPELTSRMMSSLFAVEISERIARVLGALLRLLIHIPFLPLISGLSYEIIKLSSKKANNLMIKLITGPGMALQKITTRPPDDSQVEIAIIALKAALNEDLTEFTNINKVAENK